MLKHKKLLVGDVYGKTKTTVEDKAKSDILKSDDNWKQYYNALGREQKKNLSYEDGLDNAKKLIDSVKQTKSLDEHEMLIQKSSDRPIHLAYFEKILKEQINNHLSLVPNPGPGGWAIYFMHKDIEPMFICAVGQSDSMMVNPQTEFHIVDGNNNIKSRGYIAAFDQVILKLNSLGIRVKNSNFSV